MNLFILTEGNTSSGYMEVVSVSSTLEAAIAIIKVRKYASGRDRLTDCWEVLQTSLDSVEELSWVHVEMI
jgi:hypothetical protein